MRRLPSNEHRWEPDKIIDGHQEGILNTARIATPNTRVAHPTGEGVGRREAALASPVIQSSALANLYFPQSNRGAGLVFSQFAIGTGERVLASVAQEFLLS